jgi:hypothetical protein
MHGLNLNHGGIYIVWTIKFEPCFVDHQWDICIYAGIFFFRKRSPRWEWRIQQGGWWGSSPPYWLLHKGALPHFSLNFSITDEVLLVARGRTRCSAPPIIFLDLSLVEMESRSRFQPRPVLGVDAYCPQVWCMGCTTLSSITDYEYCPEVYANGLGVIPEILNCSRILKWPPQAIPMGCTCKHILSISDCKGYYNNIYEVLIT